MSASAPGSRTALLRSNRPNVKAGDVEVISTGRFGVSLPVRTPKCQSSGQPVLDAGESRRHQREVLQPGPLLPVAVRAVVSLRPREARAVAERVPEPVVVHQVPVRRRAHVVDRLFSQAVPGPPLRA